MKLRDEWKPLAAIAGVFVALYHLPLGSEWFRGAVMNSLALARSYAREHVLVRRAWLHAPRQDLLDNRRVHRLDRVRRNAWGVRRGRDHRGVAPVRNRDQA